MLTLTETYARFLPEFPHFDFSYVWYLLRLLSIVNTQEREERNLVTDDRGVPIHDCCGDHPTGFMCQFCDGRVNFNYSEVLHN